MAIYKRGEDLSLGDDREQIEEVARAGLEHGTSGLRVRLAHLSASLPPMQDRRGVF